MLKKRGRRQLQHQVQDMSTTVAIIGAGGPTGFECLKALVVSHPEAKIVAIVRK
jgi:hypothetical protein